MLARITRECWLGGCRLNYGKTISLKVGQVVEVINDTGPDVRVSVDGYGGWVMRGEIELLTPLQQLAWCAEC